MIIPISKLIPDDKNANKHSERGSAMLQKSLQKYGAGRSILLDKNNKIIAGNLTAEEAGQMGIENVQIVESDDTKLIAVKRTDVDIDSPEGRGLALSDNRIGEISLTWDTEVLEELKEEFTEVVDELWSPNEQDNLLGKEDQNTDSQIKKLTGFRRTHILISFPPEKLLHIQNFIESISQIGGVEIEQSSN